MYIYYYHYGIQRMNVFYKLNKFYIYERHDMLSARNCFILWTMNFINPFENGKISVSVYRRIYILFYYHNVCAMPGHAL